MTAQERATAWRHAEHEAACDVLEPWEHGTVVRATRYPTYWDLNAVRVERDPGMEAAELAAVADEHLAGARHRRVDVEILEVGQALRPAFEASRRAMASPIACHPSYLRAWTMDSAAPPGSA